MSSCQSTLTYTLTIVLTIVLVTTLLIAYLSGSDGRWIRHEFLAPFFL
jgi:hypothetical protein